MKDRKSFIRTVFGYLLKILVAVLIIGFICKKYHTQILGAFQGFQPLWLIPAAVIYGLHIPAFSWRWQQLAKMIGIKLSFPEALSLSMQGLFFSLVIPGGALGGDLVKAGVLSKRIPAGSKVEGAFTVLMDRIIGMIALFVLSLILIPFSLEYFEKLPLPDIRFLGKVSSHWIIWGLVLLCLAGLGASCAVFFHRWFRKVRLFNWLMNLGDRVTNGMVTRVTDVVDTYRAYAGKLTFLTVFGILFVHLMTAWPLWFLLKGFGVESPLFLSVVAMTIANIIGIIPLFPSGMGGRDVVAVAFLLAGGVTEGPALSAQLIYSGILLSWTLLGGLFFIFDRGRRIEQSDNPQRS